MDLGPGNHIPQPRIGQGIDVHICGIRPGADACAGRLREILPDGIRSIHRRAFGQRIFQAKEVAPSFAHGAALRAAQLADQTAAHAVRVLMHDNAGIKRAVGENRRAEAGEKHRDDGLRAVLK